MKFDIILAGVGGQGVLSVSAIIASSAMKEGLAVKQSEVHGMSQRGGAVLANLRLSDHPIASDLIPRGTASLILSMEPLESLRYLSYLKPQGAFVTAAEPFVNIPNYPDLAQLHAQIGRQMAGTVAAISRVHSTHFSGLGILENGIEVICNRGTPKGHYCRGM